jgi:hypothetical protein
VSISKPSAPSDVATGLRACGPVNEGKQNGIELTANPPPRSYRPLACSSEQSRPSRRDARCYIQSQIHPSPVFSQTSRPLCPWCKSSKPIALCIFSFQWVGRAVCLAHGCGDKYRDASTQQRCWARRNDIRGGPSGPALPLRHRRSVKAKGDWYKTPVTNSRLRSAGPRVQPVATIRRHTLPRIHPSMNPLAVNPLRLRFALFASFV